MTEKMKYIKPRPREDAPPPPPEVVCLWPGWVTRLLVLFSIVAVTWLRLTYEELDVAYLDTAAVNLFTAACAIASTLSLWCWLVFLSTHGTSVKKFAYALAIGCLLCLLLGIRVTGFTGNMIPTGFRFVWQAPRDYDREKPEVVSNVPSKQKPVVTPETAEATEPAATKPEEAKKPEESVPSSAAGTATAVIPSPDDFPQFLGPNRDSYVPRLELAQDWQTKPPHENWRKEVGAGWSAFSVVGERAVTMEQFGNEEWVTCRDLETGNLMWSHVEKARHSETLGGIGPRATPTIQDDKVYTQGATGIVACLDLRDGKKIWSDDLRSRYQVESSARDLFGNKLVDDENQVKWGRAASPLLYEDLCIVPAGGKSVPEKGITPHSLMAYNKTTGEVVWEGGETQIGYASPMHFKLWGRDQIVSVNESNITGHDPANGQVLWSYGWEGKSSADASCSQPHMLSDGSLFISKGYGKGGAVFKLLNQPQTIKVKVRDPSGKEVERDRQEAYTPELVWDNKKLLKTKFTNVLVQGDYIYGLNDGILECVAWKTGKSQWKNGRYGHGQILGVGEVLLVLTEKTGEVVMVAIDPQKYRELSRFQALSTSSQAWNNLCLVGKKLLVRNADEAACFELP